MLLSFAANVSGLFVQNSVRLAVISTEAASIEKSGSIQLIVLCPKKGLSA
jgi:hypothetical protein